MLLLTEIVIIIVLIFALAAFFTEEIGFRKSSVPCGILTEYWNGRERRKVVRVNTELAVRYSVEKKLHLRTNGATKDISEKGMRLVINEKLPAETLLFLELDIPENNKPITADGKVIWTSGELNEMDKSGKRIFQTGVQFINMKPDDEVVFSNYVNRIANG